MLSLVLAAALLPLPTFAGGTTDVARAAASIPPLYSIAAFPDSPTSVWAPSSVALAPDGDVIIADSGNHRIRVLSSAGGLKASIGSYGSSLGRLNDPTAVALGPDDRIYVADTKNNRVQVFERNGAFVRSWGTSGTLDGQMRQPKGICVSAAGSVYVSDSLNGRVQVFTPTGAFLEKWGSRGGSYTQFESPAGIAVDAAGSVYVVDSVKNYVKKFAPNTRAWVANYGFQSGASDAGASGPMRYSYPTGISLTGDGTGFIVADTGNSRVERCGLLGNVIDSVGGLPASMQVGLFNRPEGAAVAADGTWFVADTLAHRIQRRTPAGTWLAPWSAPGTVAPYLSAPEAVAADPVTGATYIADTGNSRILKFSSSGAYLGSIAETGTGPGQVSSPKGLLALDDGTLLVADTGNNRIQIYDSLGAYQGSFGSGDLSAPRALAVNSLNTLFVADTGNHRVARFAPIAGTWAYQSMIGAAGAGSANGEFNAPRGVSVSGAYLYVADTGNNRVQKFTVSTGLWLAKVGTLGAGGTQLIQPASVMADGDGVLVADTVNDRLRHYDALLNPIADYDGVDTRIGSMREPASLAPAPDGRTLVLERAGCRVQVLVRDDVVPVTTVSGVPAAPVREATLTFDAVDPGSGIAATYARTAAGTQTITGPLSFTAEGTQTVSYWSVDLAGNTESEQTAQVVIDHTAPSGGMSVNSGAAFTNSAVIGVSSAVVGASLMRLAIDASPTAAWVPFGVASTLTLPATDGTHTVYAEYRDEAGNTLALAASIVLDPEGPVVTGLGSSTHPVGVPSWGEITLTWDPSTDPSGISAYALSYDENEWGVPLDTSTTTATTYTFPDMGTGERWVHIRARDNAGNWGPVEHRAVSAMSDTTDPVTTISGTPADVTSQTVTVSFTATDTISGLDGVFYRRDGGPQLPYTDSLVFSDEGAHSLSYWSTDRAGNTELARTIEFIIDRTAPVVGPLSFTPRQSGGTLLVQWPRPSDLSGVVGYAVLVSTDPGSIPSEIVTTASPSAQLPLESDTPRFVHVRALDAAGNWSATTSFAVDPRPVSLSRPVLNRRGRIPLQARFNVTGSIRSMVATGTVRVVIEQRGRDGRWTRAQRVPNGPESPPILVKLVADPARDRMTYATSSLVFRVPRGSSPTAQWRARVYWAGNDALRPAVSAPSVPLPLY